MIERLWPLIDNGLAGDSVSAWLLFANGIELTGKIRLVQGILVVESQDPAKGDITSYVEPNSIIMVRILSE